MTCRRSITPLRNLARQRALHPLLLALPLCLALSACSGHDDGPTVSQARGLDAFHSIDLRGAGQLDVLVGPRQSVVVEASPDALTHIKTTSINGDLVVESEAGFWAQSSGILKVRITLPKLNTLALNGAGQVSVSGLAGGSTTLVLSGAGELEASGAVDSLTLRLNGAGRADLSRLKAVAAKVTVNGAGHAVVQATDKLEARLNGVGAIEFLGTPLALTTEINGMGRIGPREAATP